MLDFVSMVETKTLEELGNLVTDKIRGIQGVLTTETLVNRILNMKGQQGFAFIFLTISMARVYSLLTLNGST